MCVLELKDSGSDGPSLKEMPGPGVASVAPADTKHVAVSCSSTQSWPTLHCLLLYSSTVASGLVSLVQAFRAMQSKCVLPDAECVWQHGCANAH
jgi:hypothetical protein